MEFDLPVLLLLGCSAQVKQDVQSVTAIKVPTSLMRTPLYCYVGWESDFELWELWVSLENGLIPMSSKREVAFERRK